MIFGGSDVCLALQNEGFWDPGSEVQGKASESLGQRNRRKRDMLMIGFIVPVKVWNSFRKPLKSHSGFYVVWTLKSCILQIDCKQVVAINILATIPDHNISGMACVISNELMQSRE